MRSYFFIILFLCLLFLANLFLFRPGFWFFQDAGFWPLNHREAYIYFLQQFRVFNNFGFYPGFDQGLFNFTRILPTTLVVVCSYLFGLVGSQIVVYMAGYVLTFVSFYLFSGIFFQNKNVRYILSLLYTFNPLSYTLQGAVYFNATIPLFIYSFYKYFFDSNKFGSVYLLVNIFALYIWVSYIRFTESDLLIIAPYSIYLLYLHRKLLSIRKI